MKIILSPTKKMRTDPDSLAAEALPALLDQTGQVLSWLRGQSNHQLQTLWGCNEAIARQNFQRLEEMDLQTGLTPAILSYDGIAFQHMAPSVFTDSAFSYVKDHLRILSAFYGVLRPMDGVRPYRLEMQAKGAPEGFADLYKFWGDSLYRELSDPVILNLASKEYAKAIEPWLTEKDTFITCVFGETVSGKLRQKATFAKMARGEMVRWLAENSITDFAQLPEFSALGFHFRPDLSSPTTYTFDRC